MWGWKVGKSYPSAAKLTSRRVGRDIVFAFRPGRAWVLDEATEVDTESAGRQGFQCHRSRIPLRLKGCPDTALFKEASEM